MKLIIKNQKLLVKFIKRVNAFRDCKILFMFILLKANNFNNKFSVARNFRILLKRQLSKYLMQRLNTDLTNNNFQVKISLRNVESNFGNLISQLYSMEHM